MRRKVLWNHSLTAILSLARVLDFPTRWNCFFLSTLLNPLIISSTSIRSALNPLYSGECKPSWCNQPHNLNHLILELFYQIYVICTPKLIFPSEGMVPRAQCDNPCIHGISIVHSKYHKFPLSLNPSMFLCNILPHLHYLLWQTTMSKLRWTVAYSFIWVIYKYCHMPNLLRDPANPIPPLWIYTYFPLFNLSSKFLTSW